MESERRGEDPRAGAGGDRAAIRADDRPRPGDVTRAQEPGAPGAPGARSVWRARLLAVALQAAALAAAVVVGSIGALPERTGLLLVLVLAAALCVNRQALFSVELSVTAEASVVLCTVLLFRDDAPVLAPLLVGLAAGWLDSFHWSSRAWAPMAFNSGTRAIEALLAALAFSAVVDATGDGFAALLAAGTVAAVVFASTDLAIITALVVVRDQQPVRTAAREVWRIDAVSLPLALLGAGVGALGVATSPWLGAAAILPAALVPDALLAARRRASWRRLASWAATLTLGLAAAVVVGVLVGFPPVPVTVVLLVLALLAGAEVAGDRRVPVAPVLGAVLLLSASAAGPDDAVVGAAVAALVASSLSWSFTRAVTPLGYAVVTGATMVTAAASGLVLAEGGSLGVACAVFLLGVVVAAPHRRTLAVVVWSFPVVALGAVLAELPRSSSDLTAAVVGGVVLVAGGVVVAWSGAPPWSSRLASRWARRRLRLSHRATWAALGGLTVVAGVAGASAGALGSRRAAELACVAIVATTEIAAAVGVTRVRLWRFAARRRLVEAALLDVAAGLAWFGAARAHADVVLASALALGAAATVFVTGATTIALAERAESRASGGDRVDTEVPR